MVRKMYQVSMSSGSDHMRSQNGPSCGISHTRSIVRICVKQRYTAGTLNFGRVYTLVVLLQWHA